MAAKEDPNPPAGVRAPRQFHPLLKEIGRAIKNDPSLADRLWAVLRDEGVHEPASPGPEPERSARPRSVDSPDQIDLFAQPDQDHGDAAVPDHRDTDDDSADQPDIDDTADTGQAPPSSDEPETDEADEAQSCLADLIAVITRKSTQLTDTRVLVSTLRSEVEALKAELDEVKRLRANLTDLRTQLTYAECGLYDLAAHARWRPQDSTKYRFKTAVPDEATSDRYVVSALGYQSPAAAVAATVRKIDDPDRCDRTRIYDARNEHWLGSIAELLPPDRRVSPTRCRWFSTG